MALGEPRCWQRECVHFTGVIELDPDGVDAEASQVNACKAFPFGIPEEIAYGDNLHLEVHPEQQNTITYKKRKSRR